MKDCFDVLLNIDEDINIKILFFIILFFLDFYCLMVNLILFL